MVQPTQTERISALEQQLQQLLTQNTTLQGQVTTLTNAAAAPAPVAPVVTKTSEPRVASPEPYGGVRSKLPMFLTQVNLVFSLQPSRYTTEESKILYTGSYLKDTAMAWFQPYVTKDPKPDFMTTFKKFAAELRRTFGDPDEVGTAERHLYDLRQKGSVASYLAEFMRSAVLVEWNEAAQAAQFYRGLKDAVKDEFARVGRPDTLQELQAAAIRIDTRLYERQVEKGNKSSYPPPSTNSVNTYNSRPGYAYARTTPSVTVKTESNYPRQPYNRPTENLRGTFRPQQQTTKRGKLTPAEYERRKVNNLCLYCGEKGHSVKDCPLTPKGTGGNNIHLKATTVARDIALAPITMPVTNLQPKHVCLSFDAPHSDQRYQALVDSGASDNFVDEAFAKREKLTLVPRAPSQLTLLDASSRPITVDSEAHITLKNNDFGYIKVKALVTRLSKEFPVILGMPWLTQALPDIDWRTQTILPRRELLAAVQVKGKTTDIEPGQILEIGEEEERYSDSSAKDAKLVPVQYHDFLDVFSEKESDTLPPHRPQLDLKIPLEPGKVPPFGPVYPLSEIESETLRKFIDENVRKGFIYPTKSPVSSPCLFVRKKDNTLRMCVDYRKVNAITIKEKYPLPLIPELLDRLRSAKIFTKMDLRSAFQQLRVAESDEYLTSFRCKWGVWAFRCAPFGLSGCPGAFMRWISSVLEPLLERGVIAFIDDILVYSKTEEEHEALVREVLERLRKNKLYVKAEKCEFHTDTVEFLGFRVTSGGVEMDRGKVQTILDWPTPKNLHEVRSFLGFANFYRKFIKGYSGVVDPLTSLTKKDLPFTWGQEQQKAFDTLKQSFTTADILRHYDPDLPITLETDASDYAIGSVLSQTDDKGVLRPVAFMSRKLTASEKNWSVADKELGAIVQSFVTYRQYLEGARHKITVLTDHQALQWWATARQLNRRQARWSELLSGFDFVIKYRPGSKGGKPDALTRRPDVHPNVLGSSLDHTENPENLQTILREGQYLAATTEMRIGSDLEDAIAKAMICDDLGQKLLEEIASPKCRWGYTLNEKGNVLREGKLYVPEINNLRLLITERCHDHRLAGHPGRRKTAQLIREHYWWPGLFEYVSEFVDSCETCARAKARRHAPYGTLKSLPVPPYPWSDVSMDLIEFLPRSNGYNSILVIVCRLTKMAIFIPTDTSLTSQEVARLYLHHVFSKHGLPSRICSDRGVEWTSSWWRAFTKLLGIDMMLSTAYNPNSNGGTERVNQTLEQYLRIYSSYDQDDWADYLPLAEFAYNMATHATTTVSPFVANYGFTPRATFEPAAIPDGNPDAASYAVDLHELHQYLQEEVKKAQEASAEQFDKDHLPTPTYMPKQKVWLNARNIRTRRQSKKLDSKFLGPFEIKTRISTHAYELNLPSTMKIHPVFHVKLLEPYEENTIRNRAQPPPPPVIIDNELEHVVEAIISTHYDRRFKEPRRWLVKWEGYKEPTWHGDSALTNCQDLLDEYKAKNPNWEVIKD